MKTEQEWRNHLHLVKTICAKSWLDMHESGCQPGPVSRYEHWCDSVKSVKKTIKEIERCQNLDTG